MITHAVLVLASHLHYAAASLVSTPLAAPPHPKVSDAPLPGNLDTKLGEVMGWGLRIGYVAAFLGFIVAGVKLFNVWRGHEGDSNVKGLLWVAAGCFVIGSAGAITDFAIS